MTTRLSMLRSLCRLGLASVTLAAAGCGAARPPLAEFHRLDLPAHSDSPTLTPAAHQTLLSELRDGDLVLCARDDPVSAIQRLTTVEPTYFLHSGTIQIIESRAGGKPRREAIVWHSTGEFDFLKLSPHMLGKVRGRVQSTPLDEFVRNYDALAIMRLSDPARNSRMVEACIRLHDEEVEFDPYFDCDDHSRLCCTEFTAAVIERGGYEFSIQPAPRTSNRVMSDFLMAWNVTADGVLMAGQFESLPGAQTIAVISRYGRMETYLAFRDAARLLHERVAAGEAQPRDLTNLDREKLVHFSPRMQLFMRGVEGLAIASPTLDPTEIRRRNEIVYETVMGE